MELIATKLAQWETDGIISFVPKLLAVMATKTLANEENEYQIRKHLANAYYQYEEYQQAARILADLHIDQVKE